MLHLEYWRIEYVESLRNFIPAFNYLGKSELNEFVYQEAKRLDAPEVSKANILVNILDSYILAGTFQESEKKVNEIQKNILNYTEHLSVYNEITLFFNLAFLNFGMKKYSKALYWLNEIINRPSNNVNTSFSSITRIIRLIVFYELGYTDIENHLRAVQRYIAKQDHQYQIDQVLLRWIRKIVGVHDKKKLASIMTETRNELQTLSANKTEAVTLYYFDFISWCESKIENRSFAEILQQKNKARLKNLQ
jgi:tetratricopeptide (TPR) repeat protein